MGIKVLDNISRTADKNSISRTAEAGYGTLVVTGVGEHLVDRAIIALYKLNGRLEGK